MLLTWLLHFPTPLTFKLKLGRKNKLGGHVEPVAFKWVESA